MNQRMMTPQEAQREALAREAERKQLYDLLMSAGDMLIDLNNKTAAVKQHAIQREAMENARNDMRQ